MSVEYSIMATEKQIHYLWTMCSKIEYPLPYTKETLKELTKIQIGDLIDEVREKYDDWNFQQKQFKEEGLTHIHIERKLKDRIYKLEKLLEGIQVYMLESDNIDREILQMIANYNNSKGDE